MCPQEASIPGSMFLAFRVLFCFDLFAKQAAKDHPGPSDRGLWPSIERAPDARAAAVSAASPMVLLKAPPSMHWRDPAQKAK